MNVAKARWGEVTVKRQSGEKNKFDKTKSFSVEDTAGYKYEIEDYADILRIVTNLTALYSPKDLKNKLFKLNES